MEKGEKTIVRKKALHWVEIRSDPPETPQGEENGRDPEKGMSHFFSRRREKRNNR